MDDIDAMFTDMLEEMDLLTQSLEVEPIESKPPSKHSQETNFSIGFADLNASLNELEDNDLDALMADLVADLNATEEKFAAERGGEKEHKPPSASVHFATASPAAPTHPAAPRAVPHPAGPHSAPHISQNSAPHIAPTFSHHKEEMPPCPSNLPSLTLTTTNTVLPPPPAQTSKPSSEDTEAQMKADKIKLALEKLKEAKVKKLIVKVEITGGGSKTLMVDERQTVREVIDNLFEKTHCDGNVSWCLCETNPELQTERGFEDHENLVEPLSAWTRDSENKVIFIERKDKFEVFKNPQNFYLWKKDKKSLKDMKDKDKELLLEENFCGPSLIVPDLEGVLYLKEEGKKSWKQRFFLLRASGMYYLPKGKTKSSKDMVCLVQFDNVNVYYCNEYKSKYKAPTDFCFILKHPQIQKESQYIKYLCCDDQWTMTLWVTGIRIAKYGKVLYENYKTAVRKGASLSSVWTNLNLQPSPSSSNTSTPSPTPKAKAANGHATLPRSEPASKGLANQSSFPPPPPQPPQMDILPPPPPDPMQLLPPPPPPPPATAMPVKKLPNPPTRFTPQQAPTSFPPPPMDFPLPPPPGEELELPPNFLPPPPPAVGGFGDLPPPPPEPFLPPPPPHPPLAQSTIPAPPVADGLPPPPPPPPPPPAPAVCSTPSLKKVGPPPPKRTTPTASASSGGDFMSELMVAMQKKRGGQ